MLGRGIAKLLESSGTWQITLAGGETLSRVAHPQNFGYTSKAPNGGNVFANFQSGLRDNGWAVVIEEGSGRPGIEQGETALHNEEGVQIILKKGGVVEIRNSQVEIFDGDCIIHNGDINVNNGSINVLNGAGGMNVVGGGDVSDGKGTAETMQALRDVFNSHTHNGGSTPDQNQ